MENGNLLIALPVKNCRYVILDTETTGINPNENNIIEIAAIEILKGKLTGNQFHGYIKPRHKIDPRATAKHNMHPTFFEDYFSDVYHSDKSTMENFLKFVGNSIIFAHNATFDINFINNELKYWKLPSLPKGRFRCTMRIFKSILGSYDSKCKKYCSLGKCCEYFGLKSSKDNFHSAIFDSFMTARLLCRIFEFVEENNSIQINVTRIIETDLNKIVIDQIIHQENIHPNEKEDVYDILNIIEKNGDIIEKYMEDVEMKENIIVECKKKEEMVEEIKKKRLLRKK
jgi:DNA polymerase-3 subunit epsilon